MPDKLRKILNHVTNMLEIGARGDFEGSISVVGYQFLVQFLGMSLNNRSLTQLV